MDQMEAWEDDKISLLDIIATVVKHRWFIIFSTVIGAVLILLFSVYTLKVPATSPHNPMPNLYTPEVKVRLLESQNGSLSGTQSSALGSLGALASLASGTSTTGPSNWSFAEALLRGNSLADTVAEHFDFVKRYHLAVDPKLYQRKLFEDSLNTKYDKTTGILTITYTNPNKQFATSVLNYTLDALQKRFDSLSNGKVDAQKEYLGTRLKQAQSDLKKAENDLINYQVKYGLIDMSSQVQNQVAQMARLNSDIQSNELQLQTLKKYGRSENDPSVIQIRNNIQIAQNLIKQLRTGSASFSINKIPLDQLPRMSATYANLKNNLTLQETMYMTVLQQYETTQLDASASAKSFQVIERAEVPEVKSGPSRGKISIAVTFLVFIFALLIAMIMGYFDRVRRDPAGNAKLNEIRAMFGRPRRE